MANETHCIIWPKHTSLPEGAAIPDKGTFDYITTGNHLLKPYLNVLSPNEEVRNQEIKEGILRTLSQDTPIFTTHEPFRLFPPISRVCFPPSITIYDSVSNYDKKPPCLSENLLSKTEPQQKDQQTYREPAAPNDIRFETLKSVLENNRFDINEETKTLQRFISALLIQCITTNGYECFQEALFQNQVESINPSFFKIIKVVNPSQKIVLPISGQQSTADLEMHSTLHDVPMPLFYLKILEVQNEEEEIYQAVRLFIQPSPN